MTMMKLVDDSCSEAVDARMACFDALCAQLTGVDESLAVPYRVLSAMTTMKDVMVILLSRCTALLKERIEKSVKVVEEKTIDPAIEARLAAERAKEEAEMDPATLARIREKRAAKEAKKNKKSAGKKEKKLNPGNGVQALLELPNLTECVLSPLAHTQGIHLRPDGGRHVPRARLSLRLSAVRRRAPQAQDPQGLSARCG